MKVLSVSCNSCGAPLEVPLRTRFLTCKFCDSRLEIKQSDSAHYTDVIEAVGEIREDVETIKLQNELARLDREWTMSRDRFMWRDKHGHSHTPSRFGAAMSMIAGLGGGLVFFTVASNVHGGVAIFGLVFAGIGVVMGISMLGKARAFEKAKKRYSSKRRELTRQLRGR